MRRYRNEVAFDVDVGQRFTQRTRCIVNARQPDQACISTERSDIHRHVSRAARTFFDGIHFNHGHRRFRRDTTGGAVPVTIQHHITNHHHSCTFKLWQRYFHSCLLRDSKFARDNTILHSSTSHFCQLARTSSRSAVKQSSDTWPGNSCNAR